MRALPVIGLVLATALASANSSWCPNVPVALALAKRTHRPILIAGMGSMRGVGYLMDPIYRGSLAGFIPVEAASYDEVVNACPSLPTSGTPTIVILDSQGRLLKRMNGPVRPGDLDIAQRQVAWLLRQGSTAVKQGAKPGADGNAFADAATALAMRGDLAAAQQKLAIAYRKHASPTHLVPAYEALADEARVVNDPKGSIRFYRQAIALRPVTPTELRLRLRLASCLARSGEFSLALREASTVLTNPGSSPEDMDYAKRLVDRMQTSGPVTSAMPVPSSGKGK